MRDVLVGIKTTLEEQLEDAEPQADDPTNDNALYFAGKVYGLEFALEVVQDLIDDLPREEN